MSKSLGRNALLRAAIYDYILRSGAAGYTDQEIIDYVGVSARRVRAQRLELLQSNRLMILHPQRRTSNGRKAMVWLTTGVVKKLLVNRRRRRSRKTA